MAQTAVLEVRGLHQRYAGRRGRPPVHAVRGVDLEVRQGEVFALLGPNGAGKTSTLAVLEGYAKPSEGEVRTLGEDPSRGGRVLRERIGIVLQDLSVEPYLTVREMLTHYGRFYPDPRPVAEVLELVGLGAKAGALAHSLSGGQARRLDLALGIIGRPELLFLDEPTTGFDPGARREAWDIVRELCRGGTTVLLTTHYMDEAQALADRIAVIAEGRIVAEGTPADLGGRDRAGVRIRFRLPAGASGMPDAWRLPGTAVTADAPGPAGRAGPAPTPDLPVPARVAGDGLVTLEVDAGEELALLHRLTGWALEHAVPLESLTVDRPSLEDVYLSLTGAPARTGEPAEPVGALA